SVLQCPTFSSSCAANHRSRIMPLGIRPLVDFAFKKIYGSPENTPVLIALLNAILELRHPITDVTILNPFNYQEFAEGKQIVLDVRAVDSTGRLLNIEMQVAVVAGLTERLAYYACSMYAEQLHSGEDYTDLQPAISICLLNSHLFGDSPQAHHRFQLIDRESGRELPRAIEVHTVELPKYNLSEESIRQASKIEQWVFFLLFADQYEAARLRELLPDLEFQQAITVIESIAAKTEDRVMYDQRQKAQLDHDWQLKGALQQGIEIGLERGLEQGLEQGSLAGGIRVLQQLLGEKISTLEELRAVPLEELSARLGELQQRLRSRGN
ncbi:MAG: Rpn family recombination-promoting nuclease/putative transposase, partial [Betaproteobacteria bacterium]